MKKLRDIRNWIKEHKWTVVKIAGGLGLTGLGAYLGYKHALSLEDVIDMRDESVAERVDRVITDAEEIGNLAQCQFIKKYLPDIARQIMEYIDEHPEIQDELPPITYDLSTGEIETNYDGVKYVRF